MLKYINEIRNLLNSDVKTSDIAKATGLSHQYITNYRLNISKVENMQLGKAEKIIDYIMRMKEDGKMDVKKVEDYLSNYKNTRSTQMDDMFKLFKSDVSTMAQDYANGELYIYSREDYIEYLETLIKDNVELGISSGLTEEEEELISKLNNVKNSNSEVIIETMGSDTYYEI